MRELARYDLWFLLRYLLKRADLETVAKPDWLFARVREVEEAPDEYLDLWAREHYKSTIITFAKTIQDVLKWHGNDRDPEFNEPTFCIFSNVRPLAKAFLRQIRTEFENNPDLKMLFPDVLYQDPNRESPQWSLDDGIVVRRNRVSKEATVEAWGLVDGQPTGKHYDFLIYDDIVVPAAVTTPEMVEKAIEAVQLSDNLGSGETTRRRFIGTRYKMADPYRYLMEAKIVTPRVFPATEDGTVTGEPVMRTREFIKKKYRSQGPYVFAAQMLQNPTADTSQGFKREWFRFYDRPYDATYETFKRMNRYMLIDPASEKKRGSDYTSAAVIGLAADKNVYILDLYRDRLNLSERADLVMRLHRQWMPKRVGYEKYGLQSDIDYIKERQRDDNYRFDIEELGGTVSKIDRIKRLIPWATENRIYLPENLYRTQYDGKELDLIQVLIEEEFLLFPVPIHDDCIDAISRIMDLEFVWPKPNIHLIEDRWAAKARDKRRGTFLSA